MNDSWHLPAVRLSGTTPLLLLAACAVASSSPRAPEPSPARGNAALSYAVTASDGARELAVHAAFAPGSSRTLVLAEGAEEFARGVEIARSGGWVPARRDGRTWSAPECADGCTVRYRFALERAAERVDDVDFAEKGRGFVQAPPETWLLRPERSPAGARYRLHVTAPPDMVFLSGLLPAPDGEASTYEADAAALDGGPYSSFGRYRVHAVPRFGIVIGVAEGPLAIDDARLVSWVDAAAEAVASYYGRFPVPRLVVFVRPTGGAGMGGGRVTGGGGASVLIHVGERAGARTLREDWRLVHEMVHTALPSVPRRHHWLEEGLATYVEQVARARAGLSTPEEAWRGFAWGLPKGSDSRRSLDGTADWGRTYWGGALFCLVADVRIRVATNGARALDDALRGILLAGGSIMVPWDIERVIRVADEATGTTVLADLYDEIGRAPGSVDVPALLAELGVRTASGRVVLDDAAPLAPVRRAITASRRE